MGEMWSDRVVLITGASSGLGKALALEIGTKGGSVALMARRPDILENVVSQVESGGGRAMSLAADVTDADAVFEAAKRVRGSWGRIDVLIANAGIATTSSPAALDPFEVAKVMNTNVLGAVNSVAAVLGDMMERRNGHIVAMSSLAAFRGLPKSAAYCASKAGLSAFFESLRIDLRGSGIDVTIVHPGFIKTPLTSNRTSKMPYLMELDQATRKILKIIEARKTSGAFPWQLAGIVKMARLLPDSIYDRIASRNSFRE
jgi:short-subunit dehydrogenase